MANDCGRLYIVATPIGNLGDMSPRAVEILQTVALIAAEDTRHSAPLLRHFGIDTPMVAYHDHVERRLAPRLVRRLQAGESVALISDAGTPLVSDPGFHLVRAAREAGVEVVSVPGPSAVMAALSVAGLPTDRFVFEGFLPAKAGARRRVLEALRDEARTLVFFEAGRRLVECLGDMADIFGADRSLVLARELTKRFETVQSDTAAGLRDWVAARPEQGRGECVLVAGGAPPPKGDEIPAATLNVLNELAQALPASQAAALAARITGYKKNALYRHLLSNPPDDE
ncbi:MAG TPA: 16S rRNA (cytidine(1402)-2'-O)-methyltransferase [Gammaproteobacteria bacterium]|nr:16S rRNA (cytidine(1402)-2'-O)-methyltransferase [Gammaproteobacteria bacterium]